MDVGNVVYAQDLDAVGVVDEGHAPFRTVIADPEGNTGVVCVTQSPVTSG